jgi:hypothetical protein
MQMGLIFHMQAFGCESRSQLCRDNILHCHSRLN